MAKRALITGITGQDGSYLAELLLDMDYEVLGVVRRSSTVNLERIAHLVDRITLVPGDLQDETSLIYALREFKPTEVYNLAAQSFVHSSWRSPVLTGETTALGVTRLLDAIRLVDPEIRFYQASSSEMFGKVARDPTSARRRPSIPGARTAWPRSTGTGSPSTTARATDLFATSGILFNHESPRRGIEFVTRKVTDGVASIKLGLTDELRLGNLEAKRDWGYARDYVQAMWLMLQHDGAEDFVVATGETHSIRELCEIAFGAVGLDWHDHVKVDEHFYRPAEVDALVGDASKAERILGWRRKVDFKEMVEEMVESDLAAVSRTLR